MKDKELPKRENLPTDYKERFKIEFYELSERFSKLQTIIEKYESSTLEFVPDCDISLLKRQASIMASYILILIKRAEIEGIEL